MLELAKQSMYVKTTSVLTEKYTKESHIGRRSLHCSKKLLMGEHLAIATIGDLSNSMETEASHLEDIKFTWKMESYPGFSVPCLIPVRMSRREQAIGCEYPAM